MEVRKGLPESKLAQEYSFSSFRHKVSRDILGVWTSRETEAVIRSHVPTEWTAKVILQVPATIALREYFI